MINTKCFIAIVLNVKELIRESARAKLRVIVKRTLRQYGYPPDMQKLATETVLQQAEMIADEIAESESE
ncbi:DUF3387 domain-containing protein [candidate division WOR-3 bacterium]|nr:DUF3387 domain-containing protein [candidate division WOR-3 bacterium]